MTKQISFETRLQNLQKRVTALENGNIPLKQALDQFHMGINDVNVLQSTLSHAQKAIAKEVDANGNEQTFSRDTGKTNTISEPNQKSNSTENSTSSDSSANPNPFKN